MWPRPRAASLAQALNNMSVSEKPADERWRANCSKRGPNFAPRAAALHDEVGPLLSAAGLRLQLLRMDFPAGGAAVDAGADRTGRGDGARARA